MMTLANTQIGQLVAQFFLAGAELRHPLRLPPAHPPLLRTGGRSGLVRL